MKTILKFIFLLIILLVTIDAETIDNKNLCDMEIKKEYPSRSILQKHCSDAAKMYEQKEMYDPASWYYLLAGENNYNINEIAKKKIQNGNVSNIAHSYMIQGDFDKAKNLYISFLKNFEAPRIDKSIQSDYKLLFKLYPEEKESLQKGLHLWNELYEPLKEINKLYPQYIRTIKKNKYKEAINFLNKIIDIQKPYQNDILIADNLYYMGLAYGYDKQYLKSIQTLKSIETIYIKTPNKRNSILELYDWLADGYRNIFNYTEALSYYQKTLMIRKEKLGENHLEIFLNYYAIALMYGNMRDFNNAIDYYQRTLKLGDSLLGNQHPDMGKVYSKLAAVYYDNGDFNKALLYLRKSLNIIQTTMGNNNASIAQIYNNLGGILYAKGDSLEAKRHYQKALIIYERVLGISHPQTATVYNNLGMYYIGIGDFSKALVYYKKSMLILETVLESDKSNTNVIYNDLASVYNNIAGLYHEIDNDTNAKKFYLKSLDINKKINGIENYDTALSYNNIGGFYADIGEYLKSLEHYKKSLEIMEKIVDKNHPDMAAIYNNMGTLYKVSGNYLKSLEYYANALPIFENFMGKTHYKTALIYENIGDLYKCKKSYFKAYAYAKKAFEIFLNNRDNNFVILDDKQKNMYLKKNSEKVPLFLDTAYLHAESNVTVKKDVVQASFNGWLNYKGSIFDSENTIFTLYQTTRDTQIKEKINDLMSNKRVLAKLYQTLPDPKKKSSWKEKIQKVENKISMLRNEITNKVRSMKEEHDLKNITYRDLAVNLKENELYIDYAKAGENYYIFTLDHKENIFFKKLDKSSTKEIENLIKRFREDVAMILDDSSIKDEQLKQLTDSSKEKLSKIYELALRTPLSKALKDKTNLIVSPDGALRLLPFEAMFDMQKNKYLIEEKELKYIPSGKELVRLYKYFDSDKKDKETVIFANPDFNANVSTLALADKEDMVITPNTSRAGIIKSLFKMRFNPLPGTKEEAVSIKETLSGKTDLKEYSGEDATEDNLVKIKEPKILHIATHGFFINDDSIPNPMLKSGIALSGANASAIKGKSDGIVTALKLSGLDLKGTDLVVLSACQTGVVDVNSTESVSGLSKAFIQAGAKDIVMSLWSVNDQATKDLMSSFYKEMQTHASYTTALKEAKLKMIKKDMHPFFWAPFVVNGL